MKKSARTLTTCKDKTVQRWWKQGSSSVRAFTCCSRDDSLGVKVSEEQAVDQGGFSKSRFTFGQQRNASRCSQLEWSNITLLPTIGLSCQVLVSANLRQCRVEQKEIQETRHLPVTHGRPRSTRKCMLLNQTSVLSFAWTVSGELLYVTYVSSYGCCGINNHKHGFNKECCYCGSHQSCNKIFTDVLPLGYILNCQFARMHIIYITASVACRRCF